MYRPISLQNISISFANRDCFEDFSAKIYPGSSIAIIGKNGSGKSSLLNVLRGKLSPSSGEIIIPDDVQIAYVEQIIKEFDTLSGSQRLNKRLSEALGQFPDLLLLDEPTNHLDKDNRKSLIQMLRRYQGALVVVTHDRDLLRNCIDTLWYIDNNKIYEFNGSYDNYIEAIKQKRLSIEKDLSSIKRNKTSLHDALMQEQQRAAKSRTKGQKSISQRKWPTVVSKSKATRAQETSGKKKAAIDTKKYQLEKQLLDLKLPEVIIPKFSLIAKNVTNDNLLSISEGSIGYSKDKIILKNISLFLGGKDRIAICGKNASGKSTLLKAILGQKAIFTSGNWYLPKLEHIGYLDQHYSNLNPRVSVLNHIKNLRADWNDADVRRHLNDFLFRKNEEVIQPIDNLSGGEKARLSLSIIAAKTPKLLILDEITNNLDLETKEHITSVLKRYPGAMIIVSHEEDFIQEIAIDNFYTIVKGELKFGGV